MRQGPYRRHAGHKFVSPGYFEAMGTRIIAGRDMTWSDIETGGRVALISEDFARELAPEPAGALGMRIRDLWATDAWREVIGVVQNVREAGLYEEAPSFVYWPVARREHVRRPVLGTPAAAFVIRSERAGTASLMDEVRQAVWSVNGSFQSPKSAPCRMCTPARWRARRSCSCCSRSPAAWRCCSASSGSTASSLTSSRSEPGKSAFGRRLAPTRGNSRGCSCCTGSR